MLTINQNIQLSYLWTAIYWKICQIWFKFEKLHLWLIIWSSPHNRIFLLISFETSPFSSSFGRSFTSLHYLSNCEKWKLLVTHCMTSHGSECEAGSNELSVTIHHSQCNEGQIIGPMYSIRPYKTTTTKTMTAKATTRCSTHHENQNFLEQVTHRDVFKFSLRRSIINR